MNFFCILVDELATSSIAQEKQFIFIRINVLREVSIN